MAFAVDVAFTTKPDDPAPAWQDITQYVSAAGGSRIRIDHGRPDEFSQAQPANCQMTLNNADGRFTAGLSSSPYYPNVKMGRRIRVFADTAGNLLSSEASSFEGGTTDAWATYGTGGATIANSTTQAWSGTHSLRVTWTTSLQGAQLPLADLAIGATYTISAYVYVGGVTGSSVGIGVAGIGTSSTRTSWNNTWGRLSYTFTATASSHLLQVSIIGATSRTDYIDAVMLERSGSVSPFTGTAAADSRFVGYVDS